MAFTVSGKNDKIRIMFYYKGIDEKGEIRVGSIDEDDKTKAFELLKSQGIRPFELRKKTDKIRKFINIKPSDEEISYLLLQLSLMLSSGLTLTQALETVSSQSENKKISQAVLTVKDEIERGISIPLAFKNAEIFPQFLIEMLKVAERGENLEQILIISSEFLNKSSDLKNKIFTSLTYPLFVILLSLLSLIVVVNLIIPKISQVLTGLGKELPFITKLMLNVSQGFGYLIYIFPILVITFIFRNKIFKKERLSYFFLKIPLIGKISYYFNLTRFSRMLGICLASGIPIVRSIELSIGSISNHYMRERLKGIAEEVSQGKSLRSVFSEVKVFPEVYVNLIHTGEKSGEIEKVLSLIAEIFDRQAMRLINFWLRLIEPMAILIIGLIVAFIIISVILPLTEISSGIRK